MLHIDVCFCVNSHVEISVQALEGTSICVMWNFCFTDAISMFFIWIENEITIARTLESIRVLVRTFYECVSHLRVVKARSVAIQ